MIKYLMKRILACLPVFLGITILVFLLLNSVAGNAADLLGADGYASSADREALAAYLGLDQPVALRYLDWLGNLLQLNLGSSFRSGVPVAELIAARAKASLLLTGVGMLFSAALSLLLGVLSACNPGGRLDRAAGTLSVSATAVPGFLISLLLIYVFSLKLKLLPAISSLSLKGIILPVAVIVLSNTGGLLKQVRAACIEVLREPYIKTARAKGVSGAGLIARHVLRNASLSILTAMLSHLPHIIGGSMVVEQIFGWPGMGSLLFTGISQRDYPVVMGVTVVVALTVLFTSLLLDILYGLLDPRIRYERR